MGHDVAIVDPWRSIPRSRLMKKWLHHSGALFLGGFIEKRILAALPTQKFDLVWVDGGGLVSASLIRELKKRFGRVINYNLDDPFGTRDGRKWRHYLTAVPNYDLVVVVRECNVAEAAGRGAKDVLLVSRSADEVAHKGQTLDQSDFPKWSSEVVFVGTWMPERGPFLSRLIELGVPLAIYGDRWDRAAEWPILKQHWRGPGLYIDEEYSKAIQAAKLCIGLLSVGNRDTCTQRSFEVPYLQSVLCAERTSEHLSLYQEDAEAVFWNTAEECAEKCRELLADPVRRAELAARGRARCLRNGTTNEQVLHQILSRTFPQKKEHSLRAKAAASAR
jgi:spore maturation protein CgeB